MIVAHDVNPILSQLDRVIYVAQGSGGAGRAGRRHHQRDAEPAVRHARRGPDDLERGAASSSGSPTPASPTTITATGNIREPPSRTCPGTWSPTSVICWRIPSCRTRCSPPPSSRCSPPSSDGSWSCAASRSPATPCRSSAFPAPQVPSGSGCPPRRAISRSASRRRSSWRPCRTPARARREESSVIGVLQAFALALGLLFVSLFKGFLGGVNALLFGSFLGITNSQVVTLAVLAIAALAILAVIGRPLRLRVGGRRRRRGAGRSDPWLSAVFLLLLAVTTAEVSQLTGALLVFALLVMPAAAAQRLDRGSAYVARLGCRHRGSGDLARASGSPTSPRIRSASTSPRSASAPICSPRCGRRAGAIAAGGPGRTGGRPMTAAAAPMNPFAGIAHMLSEPFIAHALLAGTFIALASGLVGFFVVLRRQVFAGDALSHVAFTGAVAALAVGADLRVGPLRRLRRLRAGARGARPGRHIGPGGRRRHRQQLRLDPRPGRAFPDAVHDLAKRRRRRQGRRQRAVRLHLRAVGEPGLRRGGHRVGRDASAVLAIARPLLFASVDEPVAAARGVPVRLLAAGFLVLLGVTAAEATQAVGSLLLLGLLAAPAGAAYRLTVRPLPGAGAVGRRSPSPRSGSVSRWPTRPRRCRRVSPSWPWRRRFSSLSYAVSGLRRVRPQAWQAAH